MFGDEFHWDITGGKEHDSLGVRMTIPALSFQDYLALFAYEGMARPLQVVQTGR